MEAPRVRRCLRRFIRLDLRTDNKTNVRLNGGQLPAQDAGQLAGANGVLKVCWVRGLSSRPQFDPNSE